MAKADRAGTTPLHHGLPDEIIWEILLRLPPKSLLRCRPVCRAWRHVTSTREFLLAHHVRQPSYPIVDGFEHAGGCNYHNILAFDHRAAADAQLQTVARLGQNFSLRASCGGLLVFSTVTMFGDTFSVCNPTTREYAPLEKACGSTLLGMYLHRPTGEYRLLLHRSGYMRSSLGHPLPKAKIGCYVLELGSDHPLRYIDGTETVSWAQFGAHVLLRDSLHWYQAKHQDENELISVFDTIAESFRQMRSPPVVPSPTTKSHVFETEGTLGICGYDDATKFVDIWVLKSYQGEIWEHKHGVELPVAEMRRKFGSWDNNCQMRVLSMDGDLLLLIKFDLWMFYVDTGGKVVYCFHHDSQKFYPCEHRLKQTLVPHTFFSEQEGYAATKSPFV